MKKKIVMPKLASDMKTGVLCAWLVEEGQSFKKGEPLFEVEANKVVSSVEALEDGVLISQMAEEGDEIIAEGVVAEIDTL